MKLIDIYRKYREQKLYQRLGKCGRGVFIGFPNMISRPELIYMEDFTRVLNGAKFILDKGRFVMGKYSSSASGLTVVTDNHTPTVGVPYYFTGAYHLNDRSTDVVVGEDCWIGTNVTLLPGAHIKRGGVIAANAVVNKVFPPYAVVAGVPAKIIAVKFSKDEIIEHEKAIYPPSQRMSLNTIDDLFDTYYTDKKVAGHTSLTRDNKEYLRDKMKEIGLDYPNKQWFDL